MKKRMTLTFKSKKGNEYLYDDSTGLILPWSKEDEKILKQLLEGNKTEDILKDGDVHESNHFNLELVSVLYKIDL